MRGIVQESALHTHEHAQARMQVDKLRMRACLCPLP